ncbi:MAG: hypothetical protein H5T95_07565 [Firmicutes bacterium]|nr:hypothetical protein [Bacillota bacterium]
MSDNDWPPKFPTRLCKVEVVATLYEAGRHEVTVNSPKPQVVTVAEAVPF